MSDHDFRSFEDFWPYYLREHSQEATRALHFAGTTVAFVAATAGVLLRRPALVVAGVGVGYAMSWVGHFFVEKNRPATFKHPLWSFQGDMRMWRMMATGTLDAEIERLTKLNGVHGEGEVANDVSAEPSFDPQTVN